MKLPTYGTEGGQPLNIDPNPHLLGPMIATGVHDEPASSPNPSPVTPAIRWCQYANKLGGLAAKIE